MFGCLEIYIDTITFICCNIYACTKGFQLNNANYMEQCSSQMDKQAIHFNSLQTTTCISK